MKSRRRWRAADLDPCRQLRHTDVFELLRCCIFKIFGILVVLFVLVLAKRTEVLDDVHLARLSTVGILIAFTVGGFVPACRSYVLGELKLFRAQLQKCGKIYRVFMLSVVAVGMLVLPWAVTYQCLSIANAFLDNSSPQFHVTEVVGVIPSGYRSGPRIRVASWRPEHAEEVVHISKEKFQTLGKEHTAVEISTKPGYLGFEWVSSIKIR